MVLFCRSCFCGLLPVLQLYCTVFKASFCLIAPAVLFFGGSYSPGMFCFFFVVGVVVLVLVLVFFLFGFSQERSACLSPMSGGATGTVVDVHVRFLMLRYTLHCRVLPPELFDVGRFCFCLGIHGKLPQGAGRGRGDEGFASSQEGRGRREGGRGQLQ